MDSFWKKLAGFAVDALLARFGIKPEDNLTVDDVIGKLTKAFRAELTEDLDNLDEIPGKVIAELGPQINGFIQQVTGQVSSIPGQVLSKLPDFTAIINGAIQNLNPFK